MADHLSPESRSRNTAVIRAKKHKPLTLRAALRQAGALGYWLHLKDIAGRLDVAFVRCGVAELVEGVFWHGRPASLKP